MPNDRSELRAQQLQTAGSVDTQVDNSAFLPCGTSVPAKHPLALTLDIEETPMLCTGKPGQARFADARTI